MSAASTEPVWHYTSQNQRKGPVTLENLQTLVSRGRLDLQKDMVWNPEMPEWAVASSIKELAKVHVDPTAAPAARSAVAPSLSAPAQQAAVAPATQPKKPQKVQEANPYGAPRAQAADTGELEAAMNSRRGHDYPGMGRLGYFLVNLFMGAICVGAIFYLAWQSGENASSLEEMEWFGMSYAMFELVAQLAVFILFFIPAYSRLKNLSMSGWNYLWNLLPIANIWLGYRLFACPPGYGEHKKLDGIGKFLAFIYFLPLILMVLLLVGVIFFGGIDAYKKGADRAMKERETQQQSR